MMLYFSDTNFVLFYYPIKQIHFLDEQQTSIIQYTVTKVVCKDKDMFNRKALINEQIQDICKILPQTEEISESISRNWTEQAVACYKLEGDCSKCVIGTGHYSFVCQMHKVVAKLLKEVGPPESADVQSVQDISA